MDLASMLLGLAICAITAVVLYFIAVKSFQEKPYEEVRAEQQQFADSLMKTERSKDKDKKPKKQPVKKNKKAQPFEEKPHVEFEPDAEVIPEEPVPAAKKDKKEKVKPILRNRDQASSQETFDPDVDSINHFTEHPPKDDVQMHKRKSSKTVIEEKIVATEAPVNEPVAVKEVAFTVGKGSQPSTPKKKKNKKTDSVETVDGGEELLQQLGGTEKLISAMKELPLTAAELQTLIEVLLNRQQESTDVFDSEWMEPGGRLDPIGGLRKQLADKEKALQEEAEEKQVYQNKLRTLGAEMTAERTRATSARKQLEESLARQSNEMQLVTGRLQQMAEQHAVEVNALRQALQQAQKSLEDRQLQRLQEEKFASQEMTGRIQQLEDLLRHTSQQVEEKHHEVVQLREALQHSSHEARARLEELERTKQLLEDRITTVDRELLMERSIAAQKESEVRQELQRLCLENQSLSMQSNQLQLERSQSSSKENELQKEIDRLRADNQSLAEMTQNQQSQLELEIESQKRKNNELRDKNYKAMDALSAAEKSLVDFKKALKLPGISGNSPAEFAQSIQRMLTEEQSKAGAQVQHYKQVLSQTEELLNRLQSRVEAEEANWKVKLVQLESDVVGVKQERDFWMEQCQKPDTSAFEMRIEALQKENEQLLQERLSSAKDREQLEALEGQLAEEKQAVQQLRDQLEQTKAEVAAAKVGSIGYMVGWAAAARKNSLVNLEHVASPQQGTTKAPPAATNGTAAESPVDEVASH